MHEVGTAHFEGQSDQQSRRDGVAREASQVGHLEACGNRNLATGLDLEDLSRAVTIGGQNPDFTAEAGEIEAKPIERFDPAAVSARGHEIGADVQNLQDLMVAVQSLIIAITSIVNTVATQ